MYLIKLVLPAVVILSFYGKATAQDTTKTGNRQDTTSLINQLEKDSSGESNTKYALATFKYTRIVDGHSVENLPAHVLDVRISHRFGPVDNGFYQSFGLDNGFFNVRVGFDYGITNNFMIGGGHNAWQKTYDGFFKVKILRQSSGEVNMPVTLSFVTTAAINTQKPGDFLDPEIKNAYDSGRLNINRLSYVFQLLVGRKFSEGFSLQLMPTFIIADNISYEHINRNIFAIGIGGSQKISKKMSVNAEYYYQVSDTKPPNPDARRSANVVAVGIDIGTGGHVFQLHFTNSIGLTEKSFIAETDKTGIDSGIRFGFNISRVFQLGKKHKGGSADWKK